MSAKKQPGKTRPDHEPVGGASGKKGKAVPSRGSHGTSEPESGESKSTNQEKEIKQKQAGLSTSNEAPPNKQIEAERSEETMTGSIASLQPESTATAQHFRVVELATQLACAQMTAEACTHSARLTVSGIQRIAAAFVMASARIKMDLETLRSNPELIDEGFVDRAYSDLLSAAEVHDLPLHKTHPLNHHLHDALFEGAMSRARSLLKSPSVDTSSLYAEQLFEADEVLSEFQVGKRFESCEWPGLSRGEFHSFMVRVERWFHDHLGRLLSPEEDERFEEDAEMMGYVLELGLRRKEDDLFRRIYELVRDHEPPNRPRGAWTSTAELSHAVWTRSLIGVIFCGHEPSKSRQDKRRRIRRYRPWGLFRYLRIHGASDHDGAELLESLVIPRHQLRADIAVHPIGQNFASSYNFGPLNGLVDEEERKEMQLSAIRSATRLKADEILIDSVRPVAMPHASISTDFQEMVLRSARSAMPFNSTWTETIKGGFNSLLLAGLDRPMNFIIEFLCKFYIPLLASYGALKAVTERRSSDRYPHELIDLFPDGWSVFLSIREQNPKGHDPIAKEAETCDKSRPAECLTLVIQSSGGKKRTLRFPILRSTPDPNNGLQRNRVDRGEDDQTDRKIG